MSDVTDLIGKPLTDFRVIQMTEVYRTNEDGCCTKSEGCFTSDVVALAYSKGLGDSSYTGTRKVLVLTNGVVGYLVDLPVILADADSALESIRTRALSKLTPEEVQLLGLSNLVT